MKRDLYKVQSVDEFIFDLPHGKTKTARLGDIAHSPQLSYCVIGQR